MKRMGIPEEEIPKFADANYWLEYFPPLAEVSFDFVHDLVPHYRATVQLLTFLLQHVSSQYLAALQHLPSSI